MTGGMNCAIVSEIPMTRRLPHSMSAIQHLALVLAVVGFSPSVLVGQETAGIARRTAARLEEQAQASRLLLNNARQQYAEGKYQEALDTYRKSLAALPASPNMEQNRRFLDVSIADTSVAVAQEYIKVGRYDEARTLLEGALKTVPDHALAKRTLAWMSDPVRTNPALSPEHVKDVQNVDRLLRLSYGYYELGQYDAALKEFGNVLRIDPYNTAARRGMELVTRAQGAYAVVARDEMRAAALAEVDSMYIRPANMMDTPVEPESFSAPLDNPVLNVDQKLGMIRLPKVQLDGVTVDEAVDYLRNQSRVHDVSAQTSADRGLNISIDPGPPDSISAKDIASKKITLNLQNIPLKDALQYVARAAGMIVRTNAFGVELVTTSDGTSNMVSKTISVPPGFFSGLSDAAGSTADDPFGQPDSGGAGMTLKRVDPQQALAKMGLKFPEGSFVKYQGGNSSLFFHGTPGDLSLLEELVSMKAAEQPLQVVVSATFLEVNQTDLEELGFNWLMNINLDPNKWFMGGAGTDKGGYNDSVLDSAARVAGAALPGGVVAGLRSGNQVFTEDGIDNMLDRGSSSRGVTGYAPGGAPSIMTVRGMWSQADITMIMKGLSQKKGTDILQHPSVIVRPGDRASFFSGREFIYPTSYEPPQMPNNMNSNNNRNNNNNNNNNGDEFLGGGGQVPTMPITPAHPTDFETRQLGTIFNVEVTGISDDKSVVEMTVAPEIVEFDGFINYGTPVMLPVIGSEDGKDEVFMAQVSDNLILQPVFSKRHITAPVRVSTGNTLVIGALKKSTSVEYEDKIPVLGDIPWVGRLFRSKGNKEQRKAIIIMVKAEIVDPGGKQLYTPPAPSSNMAAEELSLPPVGAAH